MLEGGVASGVGQIYTFTVGPSPCITTPFSNVTYVSMPWEVPG
jgi:hypothetical protein